MAVAAALPWHDHHQVASDALAADDVTLVAHVALETYSTLTRLPPPERVDSRVAHQYLRDAFELPALGLSAEDHVDLLDTLRDNGLVGGAVYDALIAETARRADAALLSLDQRARPIYESIGVSYHFVT